MDLGELAKQIKTEGFQKNFGKVIPVKTIEALNEMNVSEIETLLKKVLTISDLDFLYSLC